MPRGLSAGLSGIPSPGGPVRSSSTAGFRSFRAGVIAVRPARNFLLTSTGQQGNLPDGRSRKESDMNKRAFRRRLVNAVSQSWNAVGDMDRGSFGVALLFPDGAFADAPTWTPGPGFRALNNERPNNDAFVRDNGDGTQTVVVAGVRAEGPGLDGGPWVDDEVWTVTAPVDDFDGCGLGNNPMGITFMRSRPGAVIEREPYEGHPLTVIDAYWTAFEQRWGFIPVGQIHAQGGAYGNVWPFAEKQLWAYFIHTPLFVRDGERGADLIRTVTTLVDRFGAQTRVYAYDSAQRTINGPLGQTWYRADLGKVTRRLHEMA